MPTRALSLVWLWTLLVAAMCGVLLSLTGCERQAEQSAPAATDEPGNEQQQRIVVLSPALGVMLTDLGLAGRVVGRHGWDTLLDQSLPVCGDQTGLDYEALLRAAPTHILTEWGTRELPAQLNTLAAKHDWDLQDFRLLSLADIGSASARLRELLPDAEPAESIERFDQLMTAPVPAPLWKGRVLLLMSTSPVAAIGPGSAHDELLLRAGGVPAITEGSPFMPLHAEDVLRIAPDAIILLQPRSGSGDTQASSPIALDGLASLAIPAIEHGRVVRIDHPLGLLPSTRLIEVADSMDEALLRWAEE